MVRCACDVCLITGTHKISVGSHHYVAVPRGIRTDLNKVLYAPPSLCVFTLSLVLCLSPPRLRSPVGPMTVREQHLEGQLRFVNSRVITNRYIYHTLCVCVPRSLYDMGLLYVVCVSWYSMCDSVLPVPSIMQ